MDKKVNITEKSKRTPEELRQASNHIFWGMRYISQMLAIVSSYSDQRREDDIGGMLFYIHDAFLIHTRKMIDFFYYSSKQIYDDDFIAEDFFTPPEIWRSLRPEQPSVLIRAKKDIGKLLAHFTYKVIDHPSGSITWKTGDIYKGIFDALQKFLTEVDRSLVDEQLDHLRLGNPGIWICYPIYTPQGKFTYEIGCPNDKAAGFEISSEH